MSLVAPRPERQEIAARIERTLPGFRDRLAVRSGIAGLAQAAGGYRLAPRRKLRYDRLYIDRPWLDLTLCLRCAARVLAGRAWRRRKELRRAAKLQQAPSDRAAERRALRQGRRRARQ